MGRRALVLAAAVMCVLLATRAGAQPPPPPPPPPPAFVTGPRADQPAREGAGLVLGRVIDGASARPVAGSVVALGGPGVSPATGGL